MTDVSIVWGRRCFRGKNVWKSKCVEKRHHKLDCWQCQKFFSTIWVGKVSSWWVPMLWRMSKNTSVLNNYAEMPEKSGRDVCRCVSDIVQVMRSLSRNDWESLTTIAFYQWRFTKKKMKQLRSVAKKMAATCIVLHRGSVSSPQFQRMAGWCKTGAWTLEHWIWRVRMLHLASIQCTFIAQPFAGFIE